MFNPGEVVVREFSISYYYYLGRGYVIVERPDDKNVIMEPAQCTTPTGTGKEN